MRTLRIAVMSFIAGCLVSLAVLGGVATAGSRPGTQPVGPDFSKLAKVQSSDDSQLLALYKDVEHDPPVTGSERQKLLSSFSKELSSDEGQLAKDRSDAAAWGLPTGPAPSTSASLSADTVADTTDPDSLPALFSIDDAAADAATRLLQVDASKEAVTVGDMFEMQMLMNQLAQLSELSTAVVSADNQAIKSSARNVRG